MRLGLGEHFQNVRNDFITDAGLGLLSGAADVRSDGNAGMLAESLIFGGFLSVNVQRCAGDFAAVQSGQQGGLVNQSAAGSVDQTKRRLSFGPAFPH